VGNFVQNVLKLYQYQIEGQIPMPLMAEIIFKKENVKKCLKEGWTFEETGFPWESGYSFFIAQQVETGEKTTYLITGEKIKFRYRIYDDVLLPYFVNYNKKDKTKVKAWISPDGIIHILRNEYYKTAERIWDGKITDFESQFYMADYEGIVRKLKKVKGGKEKFKNLFFEKETSFLNLPEEAHHIKLTGLCEAEEEVLARLNRMWFNPTYTFILEIINSSFPIPEKMDIRWVFEPNPPHKISSRFLLYSMKNFFTPTSLSALSKIPLSAYAEFAEKTYFSLISSPSLCDKILSSPTF
jgi:hypothetical protein